MNKKEHKGKVIIGGKEYDCEVRDGVRYIDGVTTDEFLNKLSDKDIRSMALIGGLSVIAESEGLSFSPNETLKHLDGNGIVN